MHIEIAHSLHTDSMINALRRFISICGYPEQIRSDQGSNFTKADKELKEAIPEWNQHKINIFCRQKEEDCMDFKSALGEPPGWCMGADDTFRETDLEGHSKGAVSL